MGTSVYRSRRPGGYTLLEMIIVLTIVSLIAALVLPAMFGPLGKSRLRDAAKQVRAELAGARLEAIESGIVQEIRFQPGGRIFERIPKTIPGGDQHAQFSTEDLGGRLASATDLPQREAAEHRLPPGVCFYDQQVSRRAGDDAQWGDDSETTTGDGAETWSRPIVFYPNGRTTNARIWLVGQDDFYVDVTLRGVTGTATIGSLARQDQP